jgi:hypothetical protein
MTPAATLAPASTWLCIVQWPINFRLIDLVGHSSRPPSGTQRRVHDLSGVGGEAVGVVDKVAGRRSHVGEGLVQRRHQGQVLPPPSHKITKPANSPGICNWCTYFSG